MNERKKDVSRGGWKELLGLSGTFEQRKQQDDRLLGLVSNDHLQICRIFNGERRARQTVSSRWSRQHLSGLHISFNFKSPRQRTETVPSRRQRVWTKDESIRVTWLAGCVTTTKPRTSYPPTKCPTFQIACETLIHTLLCPKNSEYIPYKEQYCPLSPSSVSFYVVRIH